MRSPLLILSSKVMHELTSCSPYHNIDAIGRKWTLLIFALLFLIGAALQTAAGAGTKGLNLIYVGRVIAGVGIGGISAVAPAYVSECAPKQVRGRITGLFQIWVACGVLVSYFVNCK